jgi:hypothetical protein
MELCSQYCVMLLGRSLNTCHCNLCITFICVPAKDRVLYIKHQNRMPTGPVVLHTGNFVGYCQGCGVLTVLYYTMVLKYTAHKRTYTAEVWRKYYSWWKMKDCQCTKLVNSSVYDGTLKDYTQQFLEHPNCKYCKAVGNASTYCEVICRLWFNS